MSEAAVFQLERLYFGTLVNQQASPGAIARTANITPAQVAECIRVAQLIPPPAAECSNDMPGALGLFRGEGSDFILVKAQVNEAGAPQVMYAWLPVTALREISGNVTVFRSLGLTDMPAFSAFRSDLQPYDLRSPQSPTHDEQSEALLDLILFCQDSFKNVEGILAGLVQGQPITIINSPLSLDKRLRFIQGLLSMLPEPARVGITFATQVRDPENSRAQIKFTTQSAHPKGNLVYDWQTGKLLTDPPEDSYSHYIVAQLRLDPSLVIEQTVQLSRTTVWRARHRENLGRALAWVSRRAAIDQTVLENQPTDLETVASVLQDDPTLPDDLRMAYARHLLAFAVALNEPASADVLPSIAASDPQVSTMVTDQLGAALEKNQSSVVYQMLERWLLQVPEAASQHWQPLLHNAAEHHIQALIAKGDIPQAIAFLTHAHQAPPTLQLNEVIAPLITALRPTAYANPDLAQTLFLTAVETLHAGELHHLLQDAQFVRQLPKPTQTALHHLQNTQQPAPRHLLADAARPFSAGQRMQVLARLIEWAVFLQRPELVDTEALQALLVLAQSPQASQFEMLIQHVIEDFNNATLIRELEPPGPRVLIQLLLQMQNFDQAIALLEFYQNTVVGMERLDEFTRMVEQIFQMIALPSDVLNQALTYLEGSQIRAEPRTMIYCSVLEHSNWSPEQENAARRLTTMLFNDSHLLRIIGPERALRFLKFQADTRNALDALRLGAAIVDYALTQDSEGTVIVCRMWPILNWDKEVTEGTLELLRRYLRGSAPEQMPRLIAYFEDELGSQVAEALQATYMLRLALGETDLMQFAEDVHVAAQLLIDIATVYHEGKENPPNHRLRRDLDAMSGNLSDRDRTQIANNTLSIAQQIVALGQETNRKTKANAANQLIQAKTVPQNGLDLLRFIGGYFAHHQATPLDLNRESMTHILGNRSAAMYQRESTAITRLLSGLQLAFQEKDLYRMTPAALIGELSSLWSTLSLYNQRLIQEQFAQDCQQLAEVIQVMAERSGERILSNSGVGRQLETGQRQPRTSLETLRWINGYFARKHIRTRT